MYMKTELEFVCHNSSFPNSTPKLIQLAFYQALRSLHGIFPYMQDFCDDEHEEYSLAVILFDNNMEQEVLSLASEYGVGFDLSKERDESEVDQIMSGNYYENMI